jgi:protein-L-isoaspartate(D-aspartate) O-methyltransferase
MSRPDLLRFLIIVLIFTNLSCKPSNNGGKTLPFETQRKIMVEGQIKTRGVSDKRVLDAMLKIPRHKFVPDNAVNFAYEDHPLPIGKDQTISQPYIVAFMTELLKLEGGEKVLEIGTGSGYQAAILAELCKEVYTIEIISSLGLGAEKLLKELGYKNIKAKIGDGYLGWAEYAPFDGVIVTCAPDHIPLPLFEQLKENGRMVIPVGEFFQELLLIRKVNGKLVKKSVLPVRFVPMLREK